MDKYAKLFTKAALIYLLAGVLLGVAVGVEPSWGARLRFVHIHLNLLGFMIMMIAGVAYHVLPRFNARPVPWPEGVKYHFILQNAGLIGMMAAYIAGGLWKKGFIHVLFVLFAVTAAASLLIMAYNLLGILVEPKSVELPARISAGMKVGDVLDSFPAAMPVFLESGFAALGNPVARKTFAKAVTIERACKMHGVDVEDFLRGLNAALFARPGIAPSPAAPAPVKPSPEGPAKGGATIRKGEYCKGDVMVGSLVKAYPDTKPVFEKHYGEGCFSCPGQTFETVEQTARMHNIDPQIVLNDINAVIESQLKGRP